MTYYPVCFTVITKQFIFQYNPSHGGSTFIVSFKLKRKNLGEGEEKGTDSN